MLLMNPVAQQREFVVPELVRAIHWRQFIATAAEPPHDIWPELDGPEPPVRGPILMAERSLQCYVASN
jgi:glycogen operon protein